MLLTENQVSAYCSHVRHFQACERVHNDRDYGLYPESLREAALNLHSAWGANSNTLARGIDWAYELWDLPPQLYNHLFYVDAPVWGWFPSMLLDQRLAAHEASRMHCRDAIESIDCKLDPNLQAFSARDVEAYGFDSWHHIMYGNPSSRHAAELHARTMRSLFGGES